MPLGTWQMGEAEKGQAGGRSGGSGENREGQQGV